jgi:hypothetical protein
VRLSGVSATVDASSPTAATLAAGGADVEGFASVQQATDVLSRHSGNTNGLRCGSPPTTPRCTAAMCIVPGSLRSIR